MFDKVIMNPPYSGSLHLKILETVIRNCPKAEIVNLSPIRWLQDPLAEYKKSSDWKLYSKVRDRISEMSIVPAADAEMLFGISISSDLGIYLLNGLTKFDCLLLRETSSVVNKIVSKSKEKSFMDVATGEGEKVEWKGIYGVINSHLGRRRSEFISDNYELFCKARETYTNKVLFFSSEEERKSCFDYLTSPLMKYYAYHVKMNQRNPWQLIPYLDYTHPWTDKDLYEYFSLTDEEIAVIEKELTN